MILDKVTPRWDARRVESRILDAPAGTVYQAAIHADFLDAVRENRTVRALFALRQFLLRAKAVAPAPGSLRLVDIPERGEWVKLGEDAPGEFAFGAIGRFWAGETVWRTVNAPDFAGFAEPGYAKIGCRMLVEPCGDGKTRLTYEARTVATDDSARRGFLRYWRFVSPFVGYIMRSTLAVIARELRNETERDMLLNRFMPEYDVVERHSIRIAVPAEVTFAAAQEMDLNESGIVRAIIRARELILGSKVASDPAPPGLVAQTRAMGWGLLAEVPGRELVMGAITQPWAANVVFRAIPPAQFAERREPGHVKIVWTLRADPVSEGASIFRTETRAVACDADARKRFLRYWRVFSPGIVIIRFAMLRALKRACQARRGGPLVSSGRRPARTAPG
jgi:hypothetical protein